MDDNKAPRDCVPPPDFAPFPPFPFPEIAGGGGGPAGGGPGGGGGGGGGIATFLCDVY